MKASVIIPTYDRADFLSDALESVCAQQLSEGAFEVLVIDNHPARTARAVVDSVKKPGVVPIRYFHEPALGLHNARHRGAKEAEAEILVYIDDDVMAPAGWLEAALINFNDPVVAVVGGRVLPEWSGATPPDFARTDPGALSLLDLGDERLEMHWPQTAYGCNMAVRKTVLFDVKGFHPDAIGDKKKIWYRGDGETGFHRKIYDAGYRVIYEPQAALLHRIPASRTTLEYLRWRFFIQGISASYTLIRNNPSRPLMLGRAFAWLVYALLLKVASLVSNTHKTERIGRTSYFYAKAMHHLRSIISPALLRYVRKESYL